MSEPWLDKKKLADWYSCSVRSIETALYEGMPHAIVFGRPKFQVSKVEPWLAQHGHLVDDGCSVVTNESGAGTATTAPRQTKGG